MEAECWCEGGEQSLSGPGGLGRIGACSVLTFSLLQSVWCGGLCWPLACGLSLPLTYALPPPPTQPLRPAFSAPPVAPRLTRMAQVPVSKKNKTKTKNKHLCVVCEKPAPHTCAACHLVWYCSRECQAGHWAEHKAACKTAQTKPKGGGGGGGGGGALAAEEVDVQKVTAKMESIAVSDKLKSKTKAGAAAAEEEEQDEPTPTKPPPRPPPSPPAPIQEEHQPKEEKQSKGQG